MKHLQRLLREPLLHFFAIGGLIFGLFALFNDTREQPADVIVISPDRIDQLASRFSSVWKRMPTDDELVGLIDEDVRSEVYYREALALGLDKNDTMVRRRMRQKMEFLTDIGTSILKPAADELESYFAANKKTYRNAPKLAFEQIYFGKNPTPETITQSLSTLQANPAGDISNLGKRTLLPAQLKLSPQQAIGGVFGAGFFEQLAKLPSGVWSGPVTSTFGVHLVRILESMPAAMPPLEEVREAVLRDWKAAKGKEIREQDYARRRARFVIEIRRRDAKTAKSQ
jgi:hypothetical protein